MKMENETQFKIDIKFEDNQLKITGKKESNLLSYHDIGEHIIIFKRYFKDPAKSIDELLSYVETLNIEFFKVVEKRELERLDSISDLNNIVSNPYMTLDLPKKRMSTTITGEIPPYVKLEDGNVSITNGIYDSGYILLPPTTLFTIFRQNLKIDGSLLMEIRNTSIESSADLEEYSTLLIHIIRSRLEYIENRVVKQFYISFSGGVDSSLLLKIAYENGINIVPVTIGLKGSKDLLEIKNNLKALGYKGDSILIEVDVNAVSETLDYITKHLEIRNKILLSIACVEHLLMKNLKKKVLVMGQGADELFGGYDKYRRGYHNFTHENLMDQALLYRATTLIEYWLGELNMVSVTYPYLTYLGILLGKMVPNHYKVRGYNDYHRKWVVRHALKILGAQKEAYMRRKKAMQYSTGVDKIVKNIVKRL